MDSCQAPAVGAFGPGLPPSESQRMSLDLKRYHGTPTRLERTLKDYGMSAEVNNRDAIDDDAVAERLLRYVQSAAQDATLAYAEPPRRVSGGFETAIFGFRLAGAPPLFAGPLVLRLFQASRGSEPALREAAAHNALAALGYPAPSVFSAGYCVIALRRSNVARLHRAWGRQPTPGRAAAARAARFCAGVRFLKTFRR
jgi:hypothetical protein